MLTALQTLDVRARRDPGDHGPGRPEALLTPSPWNRWPELGCLLRCTQAQFTLNTHRGHFSTLQDASKWILGKLVPAM